MVSDVSASESDRSQNTPNRKAHSKITANAAALIDSGELSTTGLFGEYCHQPDLYEKNWADTAMPCKQTTAQALFCGFPFTIPLPPRKDQTAPPRTICLRSKLSAIEVQCIPQFLFHFSLRYQRNKHDTRKDDSHICIPDRRTIKEYQDTLPLPMDNELRYTQIHWNAYPHEHVISI